ncbi:hypothetical protein CQA53_05425 [Helicobacter didelphidarum]|uniref:Outer membrane protein n=1 Tax=Helicobacter didelphidarum TaxID=2040648 RepID=A0A3D8IL22_9HELI|nr:hypothetical protein [Helicobacter didelphidarum]RDU65888.1 hypothetical protein CQA53_05425 [Helicobacter didelphidarum]
MRKSLLHLCVFLISANIVCGSFVFGANKKNSGLGYGSGNAFVGAEVGVGTWNSISVGVIAGYQHYFKSSWQFANMRHGVRGYGALGWGLSWGSANSLLIRVGADWTIDFNPQSKNVWGAFAGLSLGSYGVFSNPSIFLLGWGANIGGSFEINRTHRFEILLGGGYHFLSARYLFKF